MACIIVTKICFVSVSLFNPAEFQAFAMSHPEYAKLFTTYLELQRYQALQEAGKDDLELANRIIPEDEGEDSTSDKKDD